MTFNHLGVDREAFAEVLRREIRARGGAARQYLSQYQTDAGATKASLAEEIASSGLMTYATASRRIYAIFNPNYPRRDGTRAHQEYVSFYTADKILTALGLTHLWHTELADAIHEPGKRGPTIVGGVEADGSASAAGAAQHKEAA